MQLGSQSYRFLEISLGDEDWNFQGRLRPGFLGEQGDQQRFLITITRGKWTVWLSGAFSCFW